MKYQAGTRGSTGREEEFGEERGWHSEENLSFDLEPLRTAACWDEEHGSRVVWMGEFDQPTTEGQLDNP